MSESLTFQGIPVVAVEAPKRWHCSGCIAYETHAGDFSAFINEPLCNSCQPDKVFAAQEPAPDQPPAKKARSAKPTKETTA